MEKPNIIALPTSQMMAFCDVLKLPPEVQDSTGSMITALEVADFSGLKIGKTHGFSPDNIGAAIVKKREIAMGRV